MPLMIIRTQVNVSDDKQADVLKQCSGKLAALTGKPETYVMTSLERVAAMTMGGSAEPACFVDIRGVGKMSPQQSASMSKAFCELLGEALGIGSRRIYLNFTGVDGAMWGWDGGTFG